MREKEVPRDSVAPSSGAGSTGNLPVDELRLLLASVSSRAAAVRAAAGRAEQARLAGEPDDHVVGGRPQSGDVGDEQKVRAWLGDVARIAVLVCDQPNPVSKELGARLEMIVTAVTASAIDS